MSFLIPCQTCGVEFVLPPDAGVRRVQGSVVTVRCRSCNSRIVADDLELVLDYAAEQPSIRPGQALSHMPPGAPASVRSRDLAPPSSGGPSSYGPPSSGGQLGYGPPSSGGYAPVSSVEFIDSPPNTLHTRGADVQAPPSSPSGQEGPTSQRGHELGAPHTPRAEQELPTEEAAPPGMRNVPRAPTGPTRFTASLPPEEGGPRHFDDLPPSSGTPDLYALRGHVPQGKYAQRGPDSTTRQLLSFSAGLPGTQPLITELGAPTIQPIIQPMIQGSTAPVSMDAPPSSQPRSQRAPESASQPPPRSQASAADRARERNLVPWIVGAAAAIMLTVVAMDKFGGSDSAAAAQPTVDPQQQAPATDMTIDMDEPEAAFTPPPANPDLPLQQEPPAAAPPTAAVQATQASLVPRVETTPSTKVEAQPTPEPKEEAQPEVAAVKAPAETQEVPAAPPIDMNQLKEALNDAAAQASACRQEGDPAGRAQAKVTFAPSGRVTSANVSGPPFAGTPTGGCIASRLRAARIPAFSGDHVTVGKTIWIE